MEIKIVNGIEGAKEAKGLVVIIDVFRAFSVACYVTANGVKEIIPVENIDKFYQIKGKNPNYILIGEREGEIQSGFDYGNSPADIQHIDFTGKTVVHTTSAGTQGIVNAVQADEIITGSFVNAQAIIDYIHKKNPDLVSLVCMGWGGIEPADEDSLCAEYIKNTLIGKPNDFNRIVHFLRKKSKTESFLTKSSRESGPEQDFDLCLSLNKINYILKAEPFGDDLIHFRKDEIQNEFVSTI